MQELVKRWRRQSSQAEGSAGALEAEIYLVLMEPEWRVGGGEKGEVRLGQIKAMPSVPR